MMVQIFARKLLSLYNKLTPEGFIFPADMLRHPTIVYNQKCLERVVSGLDEGSETVDDRCVEGTRERGWWWGHRRCGLLLYGGVTKFWERLLEGYPGDTVELGVSGIPKCPECRKSWVKREFEVVREGEVVQKGSLPLFPHAKCGMFMYGLAMLKYDYRRLMMALQKTEGEPRAARAYLCSQSLRHDCDPWFAVRFAEWADGQSKNGKSKSKRLVGEDRMKHNRALMLKTREDRNNHLPLCQWYVPISMPNLYLV